MGSLIPNLGNPSADVSGAMRNYLMASQALNQAYQAPIDIINKLNAENALAKKEAKQEARQAELDAQNKQLFDLKMAEYDRTNKEREALNKFNKGMLEPQQGISGLITDSTSQSQVDKMAFTPEEAAQYTAVGGDISKLTGSAKTKAELQTTLSNLATEVSNSPEYQESSYEQAKRIASGLEINPSIIEELKKYQVADVNAEKERKQNQAKYAAEAKELETKIAELKTKQGVKSDDILGLGKEWGKKGTYSGGSGKLDTANMLKYADMVKGTDSAEELQGMIKEVFTNPNIPENQKEGIAANIVLSSGAKLPQGLIDFGRLNVSVDDAQKATEEYLTNLKSGKFTPSPSKEIEGLGNEIALLEARRQGALSKANAYSMDRTEAARSAIGSKIDELLGKTNSPVISGDKSVPLTIRTNNPGAVKNASRTDKNVMWEGQIGFDEQGHAIFSSPEYGARAMAKNLQTQINKGNTLTSLLKEYATGNQEAYIKNVSNKTGIDPNTKLKESDIRNLMGAMVEHEAGVKNPFSKEVLDKGYELAIGNTTNTKSTIKEDFAKIDTSKVDKNPLAKMSDSDLKEAISLLDPVKDKYLYIDMANELKNRNSDKSKDSKITYKGEAVTGDTIRDAINRFDKYVKSRTYNEDGTIDNLGSFGMATDTALSLSPLTALSRFGVKAGVKGAVEKVIPEVVPAAQKLLGYNKVPQLTRTPEVIIPPVRPRVVNEVPISQSVLNAKNANEAARNIAPKLEGYQKLSETFKKDPTINALISKASKRGSLSNADKTEIVNILNTYSNNGLNVISELSRMQLPIRIEKEIMQMLNRGLN